MEFVSFCIGPVSRMGVLAGVYGLSAVHGSLPGLSMLCPIYACTRVPPLFVLTCSECDRSLVCNVANNKCSYQEVITCSDSQDDTEDSEPVAIFCRSEHHESTLPTENSGEVSLSDIAPGIHSHQAELATSHAHLRGEGVVSCSSGRELEGEQCTVPGCMQKWL